MDLQALVDRLMSGAKVKIERDEAIALAGSLGDEVDGACEERAQIAERQRLPIVCSRGCNGCCEEMVLVYQPEALRVSRWLMEPAQRETRDAFLAAYPAWQKAVGDAPKRLSELRATGTEEAFMEAHRAQWRRRVMCAFNVNGDCSIYPVRPLNCRNAHAVETHTRCSGANTSTQPAQRLAFVPLDEYMKHADRLLHAAHRAVGGEPRRALALCEAVHRLLQSAMAAERKAARRT